MKQRGNVSWRSLSLLECLESLYGQRKLFQFKELENTNEWKCITLINRYVITTTAPTKIEAYRLILSLILKEFYYFPFDDRVELPNGLIDASKITGNTLDQDFSYPVYKNIVFDFFTKFYFMERAYGKRIKFSYNNLKYSNSFNFQIILISYQVTTLVPTL